MSEQKKDWENLYINYEFKFQQYYSINYQHLKNELADYDLRFYNLKKKKMIAIISCMKNV